MGRTEEGAVCEGARRACGSCYQRSEEDWRVCHSRPHPAQAQDKASYEGRQTRGVWQSCDGKGETSAEDCQSLSSRSLEASHLITRTSRVRAGSYGSLTVGPLAERFCPY